MAPKQPATREILQQALEPLWRPFVTKWYATWHPTQRFLIPYWRALLWWLSLIFAFGFAYLLIQVLDYGVPWAVREDSVDRRLAALADVFTTAGFLLAALAVVVALLAYWQSIRRPKLHLLVRVGDAIQDFALATLHQPGGTTVAFHPSSKLNLTLVSGNVVSAKNPAVRVLVIIGLSGFQAVAENSEWKFTASGPDRPESAQWDGGADYLVHGSWSRVLPPLQLGGMRLVPDDPHIATMQIQWVADGIAEQSRSIDIVLRY